MVNKKDLAKKVAARTLLSQKEALQVIDSLFEVIVKSLEEDGEVSIVGFGKYYLYTHAPRPVRNPKTQEKMILNPICSNLFVLKIFSAKIHIAS